MRTWEVQPCAELAWKRGAEDVRRAFHEAAAAASMAELKTVADGLRPAATLHLSSLLFDEQLKMLAELSLHFLPLRRVRPFQGFAHRFYDPEPGKPFLVYGVVAKRKELLEEFRQATEAADHETIGELLGYPSCCIRAFVSRWPAERDLVWAAATAVAKPEGNCIELAHYYPECNIVLRYFGLRALPHMPCSFLCTESKHFAEKFLAYMPKDTLSLLALPVTWDAWKGAAIIESEFFVGVASTDASWQRRVLVLGRRSRPL